MRIVNFKEFLDLPNGTVFAEYQPCVFAGLRVKCHSIVHAQGYCGDYIYEPLDTPVKCEDSDEFFTQCEKAQKGEEIKLDFKCSQRDGSFNPDQLFAVYSKSDIIGLIGALADSLLSAYETPKV